MVRLPRARFCGASLVQCSSACGSKIFAASSSSEEKVRTAVAGFQQQAEQNWGF